MADNFLEKRLESYRLKQGGEVRSTRGATLVQLLEKCNILAVDSSYMVRADQLRRIVDVNGKLPCAAQFRFVPLCGDEARELLTAFPDITATACVVVCFEGLLSNSVSAALGVSQLAMQLSAAEIGLKSVVLSLLDNPSCSIEGYDDALMLIVFSR